MPAAQPSMHGLPPPLITSLGWQGHLRRPGLLALLRAAQQLGLTGMLRLHDAAGGRTTEVHVEHGGVRYAADGELAGVAALTRAILAERLDFVLRTDLPRPARNIHQETGVVLQSIARVLVEAGLPVPDAEGRLPVEPAVGSVLGRCKLIAEFARGASARVFLARHLALHIDVAVKVLSPQSTPRALALTANEARVLAPLCHPAILRIFDFDDGGPHPYIVMEYIEGASLARRIADRGRLGAAEAAALFAQLADGLAYIHETAGLVHGDIKPGNILIDTSERVRLIDFGLAGVPGRPDGLLAECAARGTVIGTPAYIAPELVSGGAARLSHASDIYAFGAALFHAVTGRPPFVDEDPLRLMARRIEEPAPPPEAFVPGLDPALAALIRDCLAREPTARPPSHRAVGERLQAILGAARRAGLGR